ncbi:MAG: type II toxin-antitoxin system Phd/YefM family antitoxin [Clostridia bacterium]|nr:type II toxin-antitoxin system Phd/YefM family antitoxin [Clostridia bacterium]
MTIVPMRDLKNTVEIERKCKEENGPVFVTKNGYGRLVVMDMEFYERLINKVHNDNPTIREFDFSSLEISHKDITE